MVREVWMLVTLEVEREVAAREENDEDFFG